MHRIREDGRWGGASVVTALEERGWGTVAICGVVERWHGLGFSWRKERWPGRGLEDWEEKGQGLEEDEGA